MKAKQHKKAFTIVELVIVIAVIGILAAILIPAFSNIIARANAKAALSDARSTLTSFLAENLEIIDGQLAASIVIFTTKARNIYVYGYSNHGADSGKLLQSAGNPYKMEDLAELIEQYNCPDESLLGTEEESNYAIFLRTTPSGTKGGIEEINDRFVNITSKIKDLPNNVQVFDGFLVGGIIDANDFPSTGGTNPGEVPGVGGTTPHATPGGSTTYSVTYDKNCDDESIVAPVDNNQYTVLSTVTVKEALERYGYSFDGWEAAHNGQLYQPGDTFNMPSGNTTLKARWSVLPKYTLSFNLNGGVDTENAFNDIEFYPGDDIVLPSAVPTKENSAFGGWDYDGMTIAAGGTLIDAPAENIELVAKWTAYEFYIVFDANGGTGAPANETVPCASAGEYTVPQTVPTKANYEFDHWATTLGTNVQPGDTIAYTPDFAGQTITLTAQWRQAPTNYTVRFTLTDMFNESGTFTVDVTIPLIPGQSITINNSNFADYLPGYMPYDNTNRFNATYSRTFTTTGTTISPSSQSVNVYRYTVIDGEEYILLTTDKGVKKLSVDETHMGKNYQLQANITTSITFPLGWDADTATRRLPFTGKFDGNNYSVKFFSNWAGHKEYVGLFGKIGPTGVVKNLTVDRGGVVSGHKYIGALSGYNEGTIINCSTIGTNDVSSISNAGDVFVGGFVGYNVGTIMHCNATIKTVQASDGEYVGGFVSYNASTGVILDCHATLTGNVNPGSGDASYSGGFVGYNEGTITWSSVSATATNSAVYGRYYVGGFVGYSSGTIEYSSSEWYMLRNTNSLYGDYFAGFCGYSVGATFRNCFIRVTQQMQPRGVYAGFTVLASGNTTIENCYAYLKSVSGGSGNLDITVVDGTATVSNCYLVTTATGTQHATYGFTKVATEADLKDSASANAAWVNAGCWDFSGLYVKLVSWEEFSA